MKISPKVRSITPLTLMLDLSSYPYLSAKFVKALDSALEDVGVSIDEHDTLFDIIQNSFANIIRLSSTIT